jgi:hypothetical protein
MLWRLPTRRTWCVWGQSIRSEIWGSDPSAAREARCCQTPCLATIGRPQRASGHAERQDDVGACQVPRRTPAGRRAAPGFIARRPACVERSIPSDSDRRSVVPQTGDNRKNGRSRCRRQPSPGTCAPRRSPSSSTCHQRRSAAGRRRACCPTSVPWAATDATPTRRSGPCWKPCPSLPGPLARACLTARTFDADTTSWPSRRRRISGWRSRSMSP